MRMPVPSGAMEFRSYILATVYDDDDDDDYDSNNKDNKNSVPPMFLFKLVNHIVWL
jgi:hypothetical protein